MPLVKAQCTNCGAALEVDSSNDAAICPFCGTPYVVEKAIHQYVTNVTNHIHTAVIVDDKQQSDFEINQVTLVKYHGHDNNVVIPDYIKVIGKRAFADCFFIQSVQVPAGLVKIELEAFKGCTNLASINLTQANKEKIEFGLYAFDDTPLEKEFDDCYTSSGCYVATCVYGSYDCPQVWTLRRYRDDTLGATWYGRVFIRLYYAVSPTLVRWFGGTKWFKKLWKGKLDGMVKRLNDAGVADTPYQDKQW